LSHHSTCLS